MIEKIRKVVESLGYPFFFGTREEVYAYINRVRTCVAVYRQGNATGASQSLVFKFKGYHPQKMYYDVFVELKKVLTIGVQRTFFYDDVLEVRCPVMAKTMAVGSLVKRTPDYLRFTAKNTAANIMLYQDDYLEEFYPNIEISNDKKNWQTLNFTVEDVVYSDTIDLNAGETVYMRGNNPTGMRIYIPSVEDYANYSFILNGEISAGGDINTLINKIGGDISLYDYCFEGLFANCAELTSAPALPATTLAVSCYTGMFYGCTGLTSAPSLPATTLAENCYGGMFYGCTGLTSAPSLPATTLAENCYVSMLYGCTSLSSVEVSATTWDASWAYSWLDNVSASGTFRKPSGTTIPEGVNGIPSGWTVINV